MILFSKNSPFGRLDLTINALNVSYAKYKLTLVVFSHLKDYQIMIVLLLNIRKIKNKSI